MRKRNQKRSKDREKYEIYSPSKEVGEIMERIDKRYKPEPTQHTGALTITQIRETEIHTLIDTGAFTTIMAKEWVERLKLEIIEENCPRKASGVTGQSLNIIEKVNFEIRLGDDKYPFEARVAENINIPLIIEIDHLKEGSVNLKKKMWKYKKTTIPITITRKEWKTQGMALIISAEKITILPVSDMWVKEQVTNRDDKNLREVEINGLIINV